MGLNKPKILIVDLKKFEEIVSRIDKFKGWPNSYTNTYAIPLFHPYKDKVMLTIKPWAIDLLTIFEFIKAKSEIPENYLICHLPTKKEEVIIKQKKAKYCEQKGLHLFKNER